MAETLVNWFATTFEGLPGELITFIISMFPILELRGGFISAALFGIPYLAAVPICIIANIIPIPFILAFINKIFVDAMVADNNDDVMNKLTELQKTLDELKKQTEYNGES